MRVTIPHLMLGLATTVAGPALPVRAQVPAPPPGASYSGQAFDFRRVADGVWLAVGTGVVSAESNSVVIEMGEGLLIVDSGTSPAAAWALLHELPRVTTKPVRHVVITHFHYDHAHGTQSFPPDVEVIGTEYTRHALATGRSVEHTTAQGNRRFAALQVETLGQALDTASSPAGRAAIERQRHSWRQYLTSLETLVPRAPTVTVTDRLTLYRGEREVQVFFPGRAHTEGDLVVWLPKERILATGDLLQPGLPYMGDGYLNDWADVLDSLAARSPAMILPGHGDAFSDPAVIARLSSYMRSVWTKCAEAKRRGLSAEEAAAGLDLRAWDVFYPRFPGWTDEMVVRRRLGMVRRVYELLGAGT